MHVPWRLCFLKEQKARKPFQYQTFNFRAFQTRLQLVLTKFRVQKKKGQNLAKYHEMILGNKQDSVLHHTYIYIYIL